MSMEKAMGPESLNSSFVMVPVVRSIRAVVFIKLNPIDITIFHFDSSYSSDSFFIPLSTARVSLDHWRYAWFAYCPYLIVISQ